MFPAPRIDMKESWTAQQVQKLLTIEDQPIDRAAADRLAMLLAQGTCREYAMASELIPLGRLSAHQWRRVLIHAGMRENMRHDLSRMSSTTPPAAARADGASAADDLAWLREPVTDASVTGCRIMIRFLHAQRHPTCPDCQRNRTGMACLYQSYDGFLRATAWSAEKQRKWETACRHGLGLEAATLAAEA